MFSDPKIMGVALLGGVLPSLIWLWFWLKEDGKRPEPKGLLTLVFIAGMLAVLFVLPIQKFIQGMVSTHESQLVLWAAAEEIIKYIAVVLLLMRTAYLDEPLDWPIYMMTAALGFAALENALFLAKPLSLDQATVGLLTGHLRFLGATLLHSVASGIIGIGLGLSFYYPGWLRKIFFLGGLFVSIALHSAFNLFIIRNNGSDFLKVFGFLWVVTIIIMLLFEKLRRMSGAN